jgi:hypothetical protein
LASSRDTNAELTEHLNVGPETDVMVEDVDEAFGVFVSAGGEPVRAAIWNHAAYTNLKSALARLDRLTSASVTEFVAPSLITTSDPTCDIALEIAA